MPVSASRLSPLIMPMPMGGTVMAETVKRGMRYQIFNTPAEEGAAAVVQAPWRWLAVLLASGPSAKWYWYRLVDTRRGKTIVDWARAARRTRSVKAD